MFRFRWIASCAIGLALIACSSKSPQESAAPKPSPQEIAEGKVLFVQSCSACHGADAKGLPHLGKDLNANSFIQARKDPDLLSYVKKGRGMSDPLNTTGVPMPPKGGNPALQDPQILKIIAFLRTLQPGTGQGST